MQATILPPRHAVFCAPITANRSLADCLIANVRLADMLAAELTVAGLQMVENSDAGPRTLRIPVDTWVDLGALMLLGRNARTARLCDEDGIVLAWKGEEEPEDCEEEVRTEAGCFPIVYPWDLLRLNEEILEMTDESSLLGNISQKATVTGAVRLGPGARIMPGAVVEGPVLIGQNTEIGPGALIRGATSIGPNCFIGHGTEIRNSIIYPDTHISSHCYIADSIIGSEVTLGAGTRTESLRHDGKQHTSMIRGKEIETGRDNLGVIMGDGVRTGVNTSLEAGIKIGLSQTTRPGSYIETDLL